MVKDRDMRPHIRDRDEEVMKKGVFIRSMLWQKESNPEILASKLRLPSDTSHLSCILLPVNTPICLWNPWTHRLTWQLFTKAGREIMNSERQRPHTGECTGREKTGKIQLCIICSLSWSFDSPRILSQDSPALMEYWEARDHSQFVCLHNLLARDCWIYWQKHWHREGREGEK